MRRSQILGCDHIRAGTEDGEGNTDAIYIGLHHLLQGLTEHFSSGLRIVSTAVSPGLNESLVVRNALVNSRILLLAVHGLRHGLGHDGHVVSHVHVVVPAELRLDTAQVYTLILDWRNPRPPLSGLVQNLAEEN